MIEGILKLFLAVAGIILGGILVYWLGIWLNVIAIQVLL